MQILDRLKHWNIFRNKDPTAYLRTGVSYVGGYRLDRSRFSRGNERSIATSVYNRIAMDAAAMNIRHVRLDRQSAWHIGNAQRTWELV